MHRFGNKSAVALFALVLAGLFWAFLKETTWTIAAEAAVERFAEWLGMSRPAMIAAATPYVLALIAAGAVAGVSYGLGVRDRNQRSPLQILYYWNDPEHVETRPGLHETPRSSSTRYYIDVFNRTTDRTIRDIKVSWDETPLTRFIDSQVRRGKSYERRNLLSEVEALHPQTRHSVYLFGFDDAVLGVPNNQDVLGHASHFVVRASGRDAAEVSAKFEYSPLRFPKLLRVG